MAKRPRSKLRRLLRRCVGRFPVAIEPLARGLGHPVAQHVAQLGAVGLALLAQFLEPFGVGRQLFHCRDVGCGTGGITCEFAQRAKKVTSIDTNPDAISVTKQNLEKFNLGDNVELINDSGNNALKNIEAFLISIAFKISNLILSGLTIVST